MSEITVFVIVVLMLMLNPVDRKGPDSLEVLSAHGKPLHFKTLEKCYSYVSEHGVGLAYYAMESFRPKPTLVKGIVCMEKEIIGV